MTITCQISPAKCRLTGLTRPTGLTPPGTFSQPATFNLQPATQSV